MKFKTWWQKKKHIVNDLCTTGTLTQIKELFGECVEDCCFDSKKFVVVWAIAGTEGRASFPKLETAKQYNAELISAGYQTEIYARVKA